LTESILRQEGNSAGREVKMLSDDSSRASGRLSARRFALDRSRYAARSSPALWSASTNVAVAVPLEDVRLFFRRPALWSSTWCSRRRHGFERYLAAILLLTVRRATTTISVRPRDLSWQFDRFFARSVAEWFWRRSG